ncbi:hypothetical protein [Leyella lascolaii]|nr:hypothetical protein [Leyella lascolaii]
MLAIEIMMVFDAPVRRKYGGGTAGNVPSVLRGMFMRGSGIRRTVAFCRR